MKHTHWSPWNTFHSLLFTRYHQHTQSWCGCAALMKMNLYLYWIQCIPIISQTIQIRFPLNLFVFLTLSHSFDRSHTHTYTMHTCMCRFFFICCHSVAVAVEVYLCLLELFWCTLLLSYVSPYKCAITQKTIPIKRFIFRNVSERNRHTDYRRRRLCFPIRKITFHNIYASIDFLRFGLLTMVLSSFSCFFVFSFFYHRLRFERFRLMIVYFCLFT